MLLKLFSYYLDFFTLTSCYIFGSWKGGTGVPGSPNTHPGDPGNPSPGDPSDPDDLGDLVDLVDQGDQGNPNPGDPGDPCATYVHRTELVFPPITTSFGSGDMFT